MFGIKKLYIKETSLPTTYVKTSKQNNNENVLYCKAYVTWLEDKVGRLLMDKFKIRINLKQGMFK